jgi:hypothetical protein
MLDTAFKQKNAKAVTKRRRKIICNFGSVGLWNHPTSGIYFDRRTPMNQPRSVLSALGLLLVFVFGTAEAFAQPSEPLPPQAEPNFEVVLQVILGSDDASQKGDLPPSLSGVARQLKNNFAFSNYRLVNTYLGRVANTGNFEYKSVANILGQESAMDSPSFLDWRLGRLRSVETAGSRSVFSVESFRFGARVPIRFTNFTGEAPAQVVNYESVGVSLDKLNLTANTAALVGTLTLPKTSGTMFLVLTVRPIEY